MIHAIWLFLAKTGIPLWFKEFRKSNQDLDPALIAALLTAVKGFSHHAIGSELTDLVLENEKLHNFVVTEDLLITVLIDNEVLSSTLDTALKKVSDKLNDRLKILGLEDTNLSSTDYGQYQKIIKHFRPILDAFCIELESLRAELLMIADETSFDQHQLQMLSKISELVPSLTKCQLSLQVKDLKTEKVHFHQVPNHFKNVDVVNQVLKSLEYNVYFLNNLDENPAQIFIADTIIGVFKIKHDQNTLFVLSKEKIGYNDLPQFIKSVLTLRKKIQAMY